MMTKRVKRYKSSSAYIDSGLVGAYALGLAIFAIWIGINTAEHVPAWWLSSSIVAVGLYQVAIFWLVRQYWEADKIFFIFTTNLVCLGLILAGVGLVFDVHLPADLPILSTIIYLQGYEATSFSPGSVALSYSYIGLLTGLVSVFVFSLFEDSRPAKALKRWLHLDKVDLHADWLLDKLSYWLDEKRHPWLILPQILLVVLLVVVVGLAALI